MTTYPGDPAVALAPHATHEADGHRVTALELGSHAGTHIDAPNHTEPDGATLGAYGPERFRFDARVIDCADIGPREAISPEVIPESDVDMLVFRTGWDEHWGTDRYRDHPYLAPETARRCADADYDVAVDTLNPDPTPAEQTRSGEPTGIPAHHALLGAGRLIVENLTGLARLPDRVTLHAFPLALAVDGAPIRAVAETQTRP